MKKNSFTSVINLLAHPRVLFFTLPYLMFLLIAGTLAQKYIGLNEATNTIFNAFIAWIGFIPFPGGATVLSVLFVNLTAHFISYSRKEKNKIGTYLTHFGVLVLLVGGFITLLTKEEGFVILRHGQPAAAVYDYHARDFVIERNGRTIFKSDAKEIETNKTLSPDKNITIVLDKIYANSVMNGSTIKEIPAKTNDETNQLGFGFTVNGKRLSVAEFSSDYPTFDIKQAHYRFILRRVSRPLPFSLTLQELKQDLYPGEETAQDYETRFGVIEGNHEWPSRIAMNEPLRYRGYTLYQSSVLTLPNGETASVLNVVKNAGWIFPYAATSLIVLGLLLHAWMRRHARK